jgi:PAS domain S-box-containing protein
MNKKRSSSDSAKSDNSPNDQKILKGDNKSESGIPDRFLSIFSSGDTDNETHYYKSLLENIAEYLPAGITISDRNLNVKYLNKTAEHFFGPDSKTVIGKSIQELIGTSVFKTAKPLLERVLNGETIKFHSSIPGKNGIVMQARTYLSPFCENGEITGILTLNVDMSDQDTSEIMRSGNSQLYYDIFENHAAVKLVIDPDSGEIVDANNAASIFYGHSNSAIKSMNLKDINTTDSTEIDQYMHTALTGEKQIFHFIHKLSDGTKRDVEVFSSPVLSKNKKLLLSVVHDITEKVLKDNQLNESRKKLQTIFDMLDIGIIIIDAVGKPVDFNDSVIRITGLSREIHMNWLERCSDFTMISSDLKIIPPEDLPIRRCIREDKPVENMELGLLQADGSYRWLLTNASPLHLPGYGAVATFMDITERKTAGDRLKRSEALFRSIFELPLTGIALVSHDIGWHLVNSVFLNLLGYTSAEFDSVSWDKIIVPSDLERDMMLYRQAQQGGIDSWTLERQMVRKNGELIWVLMSSACLRRPDRSIDYFVVSIHDFSKQKQYEKEVDELNARLKSMINERTIELNTINSALVNEIITRQKIEDDLLKANARLKLAQDCINAGVWELDLTTKIFYWSEEFYRILDIDRSLVPSKEVWLKIIHPDDREYAIRKMTEYITGGTSFEIKYRVVLGNGETKVVKICGRTEFNESEPSVLKGICMYTDQD